jgi:SAM-dependent methyltransferase
MSARAAMGRSLHPRQVLCRGQNLVIAAAERILPRARRRCPCCGWTGVHFRSFAVVEYLRHDVICPGCGSFERHRALAAFYRAFFSAPNRRPERLIHFAPEPCLAGTLTSLCERYETSAYGETTPADHRLDLTRVALGDGSCDAVVLNHVLDCMPDDRPAVGEIFRILRPGGVGLAVVTFEPGAITRELPVMSNSRYRIYGSEDLAARFVPFQVEVADAAAGMGPDARRLHGIPPTVPVAVLRKPAEGGPAA